MNTANTTRIVRAGTVIMMMISGFCYATDQDSISSFNKSAGQTWKQFVASVSSPKEISQTLRHNVEFTEDLGDNWQNGPETWALGTGDCEDFSGSVIDACKAKGFEATMYILYPVDSAEGHAIAVGTYNGKLWYSSNGWFAFADSMEEIKHEVAKEQRWGRSEIAMESADKAAEAGLISTGSK